MADDLETDIDLQPQRDGAIYPDLRDGRVMISGGGGGIGASLVAHFAGQGARVAFCDLDPGRVEAVTARVEELTGNRPAGAALDLRDTDHLETWFTEAVTDLGGLTCLVNNAGDDQARSLEETNAQALDQAFAVNLRHQFLLSRLAAAAMPGGSIINLGSIAWRLGVPGVSAYTAMKAAVEGMTRSMARELGGSGIRVNSIAPGWVLTSRQRRKGDRHPEKFAAYLDRQAWKEHLTPSDVARMALWLASSEARRVTGQTFIIDGGIV